MEKQSETKKNFLGDSLLGASIAGRFTIKSYLGRGASGSVYLAEQEGTGREVALKILHPNRSTDSKAAERFAREARIAAKLQHPNTITIFDSGKENGIHFIAMEYLNGRSLSKELLHGAFSPERTVYLAEQILYSLADAHEKGVIHRDLKPANVFLVRRANQEAIKVLDFGIAKAHLSEPGLTTTGIIYGTPYYMSPEQAKGEELDGRSDLYAMGVMLYEMLSGVRPFEGRSPIEIATNHLTKPPPSLYKVRPELRKYPRLVRVVERSLSKERENRFQDGLIMARALRNSLSDHSQGFLPWLLLSAMILLFGFVLFFRWSAAETTSLKVFSQTPNTEIWVNDVKIGPAPSKIEHLQAGTTSIVELKGAGESFRTAITLEPGTNFISLKIPKKSSLEPTSLQRAP